MAHFLYNLHRHKKIKHKKSHSGFDHFMFFIALMGPIMTIPQVYDIYSTKKVAGFSTITWGAYAIFAVFWIIYSIIHKDKPILINSFAFLFLNTLVLIGIFLFQR